MVKCDLDSNMLEDIHLLFKKINQARAEIKAGINAQETYAETINEINCLTARDSEYGEELCHKALEYLRLIKAAEYAEISIQNCLAELETKYEIPAEHVTGGEGLS